MSAHAASEEPWTIARVLSWAGDDFRSRGFSQPRLDAELLLGHALGIDRVRLIMDAKRPLERGELSLVRELIKRRRGGEPIAYILGQREFYALPMRVDPRVLIPRPDSEALVEEALSRTRRCALFGLALDLCTGSGCVAIAFAKQRPCWKITLSDLSEDALAVAMDNAVRLGVVFGASFVAGDLFVPLAGQRFDLITANPPYIPSRELPELEIQIRDFEPRLALDGGADGLDVIRRIVGDASAHLNPGGALALEVAHDQGPRVDELLRGAGFVDVQRRRDYGGHERIVSGILPR